MLDEAGSRTSDSSTKDPNQTAGKQTAQTCGFAITPIAAHCTTRQETKGPEPNSADDSPNDRAVFHIVLRFRDGSNVYDRELFRAVTLSQDH